MSAQRYILAIDQGTSSTKTLIFDEAGQSVAKGSTPLQTNYLDNGFVEQDPEEIYQNVLASVKNCLVEFDSKGLDKKGIAGIGISNQRETFLIWNKDGRPYHPAVVWQCKRSVQICEQLKRKGFTEIVREKTGLVIDPYFSATKLIWLYQNHPAIKLAIKNGNAYFGTIDTWLLYKFTGGKVYATDYTNASRTLFFNLHSLQWDDELVEAFGLTGIQLPAIRPSSYHFGETTLDGLLKQSVPVAALIGDSHAAAFGEGCFQPGTAKATLGTGCSILMNIGDKPVKSNNGMVTTICWSTEDQTAYALEGVIVSCGATIEWLKNELQLFKDSKETETMANAVSDNGGVYLIPAFSGLGSPHWQMDRRASISGISFNTSKNHIARAALESIPYQINDVILAMEKDARVSLTTLNADGGITANKFVMQFLTNLLNKEVSCIGMPDVSALGAGYLAGLNVKIYNNLDHLSRLNTDRKIYQPSGKNEAKHYYSEWKVRVFNKEI